MSVTVLTGDCRTLLATLEAESIDCVVTSPLDTDRVQFLGVAVEGFHCVGKGGRARRGASVAAAPCHPRFQALRLDLPKLQTIERLFSLDLEVGQQRTNAIDGPKIRCIPRVQRLPSGDRGFCDVERSAEIRLEHFRHNWRHLPKRDPLAENGRAGIAANAHGIGRSFDADRAVAVDRTCQIGQFTFHNATRASEGMSL